MERRIYLDIVPPRVVDLLQQARVAQADHVGPDAHRGPVAGVQLAVRLDLRRLPVVQRAPGVGELGQERARDGPQRRRDVRDDEAEDEETAREGQGRAEREEAAAAADAGLVAQGDGAALVRERHLFASVGDGWGDDVFRLEEGDFGKQRTEKKTKGSLGEVERWYADGWRMLRPLGDRPPFSAGQWYAVVSVTELGYESLEAEEARIKRKKSMIPEAGARRGILYKWRVSR